MTCLPQDMIGTCIVNILYDNIFDLIRYSGSTCIHVSICFTPKVLDNGEQQWKWCKQWIMSKTEKSRCNFKCKEQPANFRSCLNIFLFYKQDTCNSSRRSQKFKKKSSVLPRVQYISFINIKCFQLQEMATSLKWNNIPRYIRSHTIKCAIPW